MEEYVDVLDEFSGKKTGEVISKKEAHRIGKYHGSVHILLISKDKKKILLQKRCAKKNLFPNMWDITVGGHISAGEEPIVSAHRELEEELRLDANKYEFKFLEIIKEEFLNNGVNSKEFVNVYLIEDDININNIKLQAEEVSEAAWFTKEELLKLIDNKEIINHNKEFEIIKEILV